MPRTTPPAVFSKSGPAPRDAEGWLITVSGILGPLLLICYFTVPALAPSLSAVLYGSNPSTEQVVQVGKEYQQLLLLGTWIQATGAMLSVVFFVGLARRGPALGTLAGALVVVAGAALVGIVLGEGAFTSTWALAASAGEATSARVAFDQMASFVHLFPIVPAPAVYMALGVVLLRSRILPRAFAPLALALGGAFEVVGFAAALFPAIAIVTAGLAGLQSLWVLAAAIALALRVRSGAGVGQVEHVIEGGVP